MPSSDSVPLSRTEARGPVPGVDSTSGTFRPGPAQPDQQKRGPGAALLLVLAPLLCCGGPLLIGALATAGATTLGTVGGVIAGLIAVAAVGVWLRRRRRTGAACCPPGRGGRYQ